MIPIKSQKCNQGPKTPTQPFDYKATLKMPLGIYNYTHHYDVKNITKKGNAGQKPN